MTQAGNPSKFQTLTWEINRVQDELAQAQDAINEAAHSTDGSNPEQRHAATLVETLSQLSTTLEELHVAQDEIQVQTEELQSAHGLLEQERQRYRELFDYAPEAYLLTDIYALVHEANQAAARLLNVPAPSLRNKPLAVFITPETKQAFYRLLVTARDAPGPRIGEFQLKPRHQSPIDAEFTVVTTRDGDGKPITQRWLIRNISHRKQIEAELVQSREKLQTFAANVQSAREDERTRVAREIHDELGQTLTGLRLDLGIVKKQVPDSMPEVRDKLDQISATVVNTIQTVRRIMTDLRPSVLDEAGLIAAMEWQCRDFKARTGMHCRFLTQETQLDLDQEGTNALFRLTQEMLTNAARHSRASRVTVELKQNKRWVQLEVRDNGRGITDEEINNPVTAGLLGMRERVRLLDGEIDIRGVPNRGTRIRIKLLRNKSPG